MRHIQLLPVCSLLAVSVAACMATAPAAVAPATAPPAPPMNPFAGARLYGDPDFVRVVETAAAKEPAHAAALRKAAAYPTAVWLESINDARSASRWLDDAERQQRAAGGQPVVPLFVLYNLPDRDCNAASSSGELASDRSGEARYQREFVDVIAAHFKAHPSLRIAAVLEPDSLANLATNLGTARCAAAEHAYRHGIAYAISRLSLPNVYLYVDAAHAGWLGWKKNLTAIVSIFKDVLALAGGPDRIRGFAVNISNYDVTRNADGRRTDANERAPDELGYVTDLGAALAGAGITGKGFIIDTGRNGRDGIRTAPGNWCNVKGAGLGERPRAAPAAEVPSVDAYLWIKTPGESDGTSDRAAPRFDENCASDDAHPGAPQAGDVFAPYLLGLVQNAAPPL